jgi:hypothetical protein
VYQRPHIASLFAIAVILASGVNLAIIYVATSHPRAVIRTAVTEAKSSGQPTTIPRPRISIEDAMRRGDAEAVKQHMYWCLKEGTCDLDRYLRLAAGSNNPMIAKILIAAGAKVDTVDKQKDTPLITAASTGRTDVAEVLIAAGADTNVHDLSGATPLHAAAAWGHVELIQKLLAAGANPNAVDASGQTPLHLVASRRVPPLSVYADVARMLLDAGAHPNARTSDGSTPLKLAELSASRLSLDGNVKATGDANEVATLLRDRGGHD